MRNDGNNGAEHRNNHITFLGAVCLALALTLIAVCFSTCNCIRKQQLEIKVLQTKVKVVAPTQHKVVAVTVPKPVVKAVAPKKQPPKKKFVPPQPAGYTQTKRIYATASSGLGTYTVAITRVYDADTKTICYVANAGLFCIKMERPAPVVITPEQAEKDL